MNIASCNQTLMNYTGYDFVTVRTKNQNGQYLIVLHLRLIWFYSTLFDILYDWQCITETLMYLGSTHDFNWNQEKNIIWGHE